MVLAIQLIGVAFLAALIYMSFLFYKRNTYTRGGFIFWTLLWLVGIVMLLIPGPFENIVEGLKFARATDFYLTAGLMLFAAITFLNYANVKRQERRVEELVREIALKNVKRRR